MTQTTLKLARLVALVTAMAVVAGCNTISGMGKDVQAGGRAVEKAADKTKEKM